MVSEDLTRKENLSFLKSFLHSNLYLSNFPSKTKMSLYFSLHILQVYPGPSSAFEKWFGHETSQTFYECRRQELVESTRGGMPPLVLSTNSCLRRGGVEGTHPRKNYTSGRPPEKKLYFRTFVETILMHFGTIFALVVLLIL